MVISFFTSLMPSTSLAYSVVSSFWARLEASPRRLTTPSFTYTSVPLALTFRWNKSADFTFVRSHPSECSAGLSPLIFSWWSTLFTPGRLSTVFSTNDRWDASATHHSKLKLWRSLWVLAHQEKLDVCPRHLGRSRLLRNGSFHRVGRQFIDVGESILQDLHFDKSQQESER